MPTRPFFVVLTVLIGWGIGNVAQACKPPLMIMLAFDEGSATLGRDQVVLLANRLDHFRRLYPHLEAADIEGVARDTAPDAKQLAQRRALEAARAVRVLFDGAKLHVSSNVYPSAWSTLDGNYAGINVAPPMKDMSDCLPVPIPGFKY
jgi:hypothetical protein